MANAQVFSTMGTQRSNVIDTLSMDHIPIYGWVNMGVHILMQVSTGCLKMHP